MNPTLFNKLQGNILIVDDLPDNLRVLSGVLHEQGFQVRCAKSGFMAIAAIQKAPPNLVLLDINMPEMDGYEVCRRLKGDPQTADIPIIFLSALDDVLDKVKAFEVGGADYITKPFQVEEVLVRVRHQLALRAAQQEVFRLNLELEQRVQQRTSQLRQEMTERAQAELRLKESEQKLESILNALEEVVWSTTVPQPLPNFFVPGNYEFLYINQAAEKVYGYSVNRFFNQPTLCFEMIHPHDLERFKREILHLQEQNHLEIQYRIVRPDGEIRWLRDRRQLIRDAQGKPLRVDGIVADITDRQKIEAQLRHDALHDGLTGLPNRTLFLERVEQAVKRSQRHPTYLFAVLFIDLDRFKMVNDSLGHTVGDKLLVAIGQVLQTCMRNTDMVARLSGDEFTILLEDLHALSDATLIAERLLMELSQPFDLEGQTVFTGASIGLVLGSSQYQDSAMLLRDADIAMYCAKSQGKGCYTVFDQEMYHQTITLSQLERDLRKALERQEFLLHYQPIFNLQTNQLFGFEALIRWQHSDRGMVSPAEFIPLAEEAGLIVAVGKWVLREACQQLRTWQMQFPQTYPLKISVNVSGKQIQEPNWIYTLDQILAETGLEGKFLRLEMTESLLMDQGQSTLELLSQLRSRQISLSIDDFGTGYSSLGYLRRFPINTLKIDRSFVSQMNLDTENFEIVRTIITLAHTLGIDVVAEGVETSEQLETLKSLNCDFAQGYFFSKPMNIQEVETTLIEFLSLTPQPIRTETGYSSSQLI